METERIISLEARPGQALEWLCLLPLGEVTLGDEREPFYMDQEALAVMVRRFQARGLDLVIDYEHQTLSGGKAPAAGWIKDLEAREDGLWAWVEWTEEARGHLEAKEYRYFSPVLRLEKARARPVAVLHAALTNTPATNHFSPLVAKDNGPEETVRGPGRDQTMKLELSEKKGGEGGSIAGKLETKIGTGGRNPSGGGIGPGRPEIKCYGGLGRRGGPLGPAGRRQCGPSQGSDPGPAKQSGAAKPGAGGTCRAEKQAKRKPGPGSSGRGREGRQNSARTKGGRSEIRPQRPGGLSDFCGEVSAGYALGELNFLPDADPGEGLFPSSEMICEALGITPEAFKFPVSS